MEASKHLTIRLLKSEIDYDVGMITHVISNRQMGHGWTPEQGFNIANTQDKTGEVNLIARFEELAINELKGALGRYMSDPGEDKSDNNLENAEVELYIFELDVPPTFKNSYTHALRSAMHEYVVNRTLYLWFMRVKPDEAILYKELYEDALSAVKSAINKRTGIAKLKPYPRI